MAQVTDERLAELIAWEEADIPDYQAVNDEAGARCVKDSLDLIAALRELVKRRAKLAGVEAVLPKRSGSICEHGAYADFCGPCAVRACEAIHAVLSASDSKEG